MMKKKSKHTRRNRIGIILIAVVLFLCLGGTAVSLITNNRLPVAETETAQLSELEKARLAEIIQLRQTLGDTVWPGWGAAEIPVIVYNDAYAFLVGYDGNPPAGWQKVPQNDPRGGAWQPVPDNDFQGATYYRVPLAPDGPTPEAFTVLVGEQWTASMQTRAMMRVTMAEEFRSALPGAVREALPYALVANIFLRNSDSYIGTVLHESFHAYQGQAAPARLTAAEQAAARESAYPAADEAFTAAWQEELDLLQAALRAETDAEAFALVRQFLDARDARRAAAGLSPALIDYELQREWLEGAALYTELTILRAANENSAYQPATGMSVDPEFDGYDTFARRWQQETDQITRMASNEGDGRFYYSGMAQAALLDRLLPEWKVDYFDSDQFLEELLRTAVHPQT